MISAGTFFTFTLALVFVVVGLLTFFGLRLHDFASGKLPRAETGPRDLLSLKGEAE